MSAPVKYVGLPDGPKVFVPEIGAEVGTFAQDPGGGKPALRYHVPLKCRGPYRPEELANFNTQITYRTDDFGYALCEKFTLAGEKCFKRAVNRSPACTVHGGRLHPLDKLEREIPEDQEAQELSRYQQYLAGQLTVDDLEDEELACCGFRTKNGSIYKPRNVPRELAQAFNKAIFDRAHRELRANTVDAARTIAEIMKNTTVEPDIRLKAASILLDRNLGKAPQVVALTADRGFEEIFSDIFTGTRQQSRAARDIVDAEVIADPQSIAIESGDRRLESDSDVSGTLGNDSKPQVAEDNSRFTDGNGKDARLFERNDAILTQTLETKPFEYDLSDHSQEVKDATKKRYASRALGVNLTTPDYPLERVEENGFIRWVDPKNETFLKMRKSSEKKRKTYTLSDFD